MSSNDKGRVKFSTWTPLSNEGSNSKFDKWNNQQRKKVFEDLLEKCKLRQLEFVGGIVKEKVPVYCNDFTRVLPRVISLYIFSFLDPRSLCRSSRVCWFWRFLTELDEIWMPKCVRLGWYISFSPSPFEQGIWKRHYIENLKSLRYLQPKLSILETIVHDYDTRDNYWKEANVLEEEVENEPEDDTLIVEASSPEEVARLPEEVPVDPPTSQFGDMSINGSPRNEDVISPSNKTLSNKKTAGLQKPPPWRGSDPVPKDTWRYNYLQNEDEVEKIAKLRKKGAYGAESEEISQRATSKVKTGSNKLNTIRVRSRSLPRNKTPSEADDVSVDGRSQIGTRPEWAQQRQGAPFVSNNMAKPGAALRPAPVRPPSAFKPTRTERDLPTSQLFPENPWKVPKTEDEEYDSDY